MGRSCRVARVVLVAAHRCARPMSLRGLGYAGPRDAVLRAPAIDCGYAPISAWAQGPRAPVVQDGTVESEAEADKTVRQKEQLHNTATSFVS